MQIQTNIRVTDWLPQNVPHGYGCGYIGLPKEKQALEAIQS